MEAKNEVNIVTVTPGDRERLLEFLRRAYYTEEPISIGVEPQEQCEEDEDFTVADLSRGLSLMAVDGTGRVIAASTCCIIVPGDADQLWEDSKTAKCQKWAKILQLLSALERRANICARFEVPRALHMNALAVDKETRGQSLGKRLIEATIQVAMKAGFPILSMDCTSVFSQKIAADLGLQCVQTLEFSDFKDENGVQIFRPPLPHTNIKTYVKVF